MTSATPVRARTEAPVHLTSTATQVHSNAHAYRNTPEERAVTTWTSAQSNLTTACRLRARATTRLVLSSATVSGVLKVTHAAKRSTSARPIHVLTVVSVSTKWEVMSATVLTLDTQEQHVRLTSTNVTSAAMHVHCTTFASIMREVLVVSIVMSKEICMLRVVNLRMNETRIPLLFPYPQ